MTANQIANASNIEQARHNNVMEQETERHDRETERISELVAANNAWYQRETAALQDRYNVANLALQKAQGDRKLDLQAEMQDIQSKMNDATINYNNRRLELSEELNTINKDYNEAQAKWLLEVNPELISKELEYKKRANEIAETRTSNDYVTAMKKIQTERERNLQDYEVKFGQLSQEAQRISLAQEMWETNKLLAESNVSYNEARTELTETQNKYLPQENTRNWVNTFLKNKSDEGSLVAKVALSLLGF